MKKQTILSIAIACLMLFTLANFNVTSAQNTVEDQYWDLVKNSKSVNDFEGYLKEYPKGKYAPLARLKIKLNSKDKPNTNNNENFLITPNSVGDIKLGMTIAEARKIFKDAKFEQYNYSEEGIWVEVTKGEKNLMRFTTDQKDVDDGDANGLVKIDESARIDTIEFSDERYKTADGIHIGSSIKDAEKIFGNLTKIDYWGLDASEHIEFTKTPKIYSFEVSAKKGSPVEARAGIYSGDDTTTKRYNSGAYISNIQVSKFENDTTSNNDAPKFEDYPAEETYTGRKASLKLDSFGSQFKTRLSNALKNGKPKFAGRYIVADWGCGSGGCNTGAIIDAKTGQAYSFPVSLSSVNQYDSDGIVTGDFQNHEFQLNSRLMIFSGNLEGSEHTDGNDIIEYYEFRDGKFIFIKSMPYGKSK